MVTLGYFYNATVSLFPLPCCHLSDYLPTQWRGNACLINTTNNVKMTYLTLSLKWNTLAVVHSTRLTLKTNGLTAQGSVIHPLPGNRDSPAYTAGSALFATYSRENPLPEKSWGLNIHWHHYSPVSSDRASLRFKELCKRWQCRSWAQAIQAFTQTAAQYTAASQISTKVLDFRPPHKCTKISSNEDDSNSTASQTWLSRLGNTPSEELSWDLRAFVSLCKQCKVWGKTHHT